jgi:hypothetical protein
MSPLIIYFSATSPAGCTKVGSGRVGSVCQRAAEVHLLFGVAVRSWQLRLVTVQEPEEGKRSNFNGGVQSLSFLCTF